MTILNLTHHECRTREHQLRHGHEFGESAEIQYSIFNVVAEDKSSSPPRSRMREAPSAISEASSVLCRAPVAAVQRTSYVPSYKSPDSRPMRAGGLGFPGLFPRDPRPSQAMVSNWGRLTGCVLRVATSVRRETSQLLIYYS